MPSNIDHQTTWNGIGIIWNPSVSADRFPYGLEIANGVTLERIPEWVLSADAIDRLSQADQDRVQDAELIFRVEYQAEALGSKDPTWEGNSQRSIQNSVDEKLALTNLALWIAKPTPLTCEPIVHFARENDSTSFRSWSLIRPVRVSDAEEINVLSHQDIVDAGEVLNSILKLKRDSNTWAAVRMLMKSTTEQNWENRYLFHWIVLESLFGAESPGELTYRLSQRIAFFSAENSESRSDLYKLVKDAYSTRSKIVHGRSLKKLTSDKSLELISSIEEIIRVALSKILACPTIIEIFDGEARETYLDNLIFS